MYCTVNPLPKGLQQMEHQKWEFNLCPSTAMEQAQLTTPNLLSLETRYIIINMLSFFIKVGFSVVRHITQL